MTATTRLLLLSAADPLGRPDTNVDEVVEGYVERHLDIDAICRPGLDRAVVAEIVRKIDRSEYKRRQAAPGLKISSKAFGVGRRFPVAASYSTDRLPGVAPDLARSQS